MKAAQSTRRLVALGAASLLAVSSCAQGTTTDSKAGAGASSSSAVAANKKVILIGDQPFGDSGPMDDMAAALEQCASKNGMTVKKITSLDPSGYQSSIQGAAQQGYGLVFTTFPQMAAATRSVAASFPDAKFGAIYQDINNQGGAPVPNVSSSSFDVKDAAYAQGVMASTLSTSKKLGFIVGALDPTISAELNAFIQGAKSVATSAQVYWANADTFTDPAKGKDLAQSMIGKGVDVLSTAAGQTQLGALDAAKGAKILFFGDNGDNSSVYPTGFVSDLRSELGKNLLDLCNQYAAGTFPGGKHTVYDLMNGGADVDTKLVTKWGQAAGRQTDADTLIKTYDDLVKKISEGSVDIPNVTTAPQSAG